MTFLVRTTPLSPAYERPSCTCTTTSGSRSAWNGSSLGSCSSSLRHEALVAADAGAPGLTATTMQLGVVYVKPAGAAFDALGIKGVSFGDQTAYAKIVIDDVNKHGGVLGRQLVPTYYGFDSNPGAPDIPVQE